MNISKQGNIIDLNFRALLAILLIMAVSLLSSSVQAYDAPPKDQGHSGPECKNPDSDPDDNPCQQGVADPVTIKDGNFRITETDFVIPGVGFSLGIHRSFNNQHNLKEGPFGFGWTFNYAVSLLEINDGVNNQVIIKRGDGVEFLFQANSDGSYTSPHGRFLSLTKSAGIFSLTAKNGNVQRFDSSGRRISIADSNNNQMTFSYDSAGRLTTVIDATARTMTLQYNSKNKISKVIDPANRTFLYAYDENNNLISFTDPNTHKTEYIYDDIHRMTAKKNAKGVEIVRNTYGAQNKVTQQFLKGGTFNFTYYDGYTRVCNRRNYCTNYYYNETGNPTRIHKPVVGSSYRTYDDDLNLVQYKEENNSVWNYTYDNNGNLLTVTDPNNHTITYTYEPNFNKVASNTDAKQNTTQFEYDAKGNLTKITNALNQVVLKVNSYDTQGNPLEIEEGNGVKSQLSYDLNGQLVGTTIDGSLTNFSYDNIGNVTKMTLPDGQIIDYQYDAAGRLTEINDADGNKFKFILDAVGNILSQEIVDNIGIVRRKQSRTFDNFDRNKELITADNRKTLYEYDNNDNVFKVTDALHQLTQSTFDGLDRLTQITDALSGITKFNYDHADRLINVTDPTGLSTQYNYDKVGNLLSLISPDIGQATNTYDEADNLLTSTDARGITATNNYDGLHRLIGVTYPNTLENLSLSYDDTSNGNNGIGRLTGFSDQSGHSEFQYDTKGQLINERYTLEGKAYSAAYQYDAAGKLIQFTYPSGRVVNYSYNALGEVLTVTTAFAGITKPLATNISYFPFGPMQSMTYGNGLILTQSFDHNYRLLTKEVNGLAKFNFTYSAIDNIIALTDDLNGGENQSFAYDPLYRLTSATGGYGDLAYSYDKVGNRLTETDDGVTDSYAYATDSHHLKSVIGENNTVFTYDAAGNTLRKNGMTFVYNDRGRMTQAINNNGIISNYLYNAEGERVVKKVGSVIIHFHYDLAGQLIAETTAAGDVIKEYIYLGREPVAAVAPTQNGGNVYFIHTDHLGTPKTLTNKGGSSVWKASYEPFGQTNQPINLISFNLRFPGQYYDAETGLNYNYFRDYDPIIGRYVQSDPVGLVGGINRYIYGLDNPIQFIDRKGALACGGFCVGAIIVGGGSIIHWTRNFWNDPVENISDVNDWTELTPDESIYHKMGPGNENNRKFVSPDGHSEAVFDGNGCLVTDPLNEGTFNFFGPRFLKGGPHGITDVLPYFILGNSPIDMFTGFPERISTTYNRITR